MMFPNLLRLGHKARLVCLVLVFLMFIHLMMVVSRVSQEVAITTPRSAIKLKIVPRRNFSSQHLHSQVNLDINSSWSLRNLLSVFVLAFVADNAHGSHHHSQVISSHRGVTNTGGSGLAVNHSIQDSFQQIMTRDEKQQLMQLTRVFVDVVNSHKLTYFMYGGTLIGSWRHHGMVPWDDDVDVIVNGRQRTRLKIALTKLGPDYTLVTGTVYRWKFFFSNSTLIKGMKHGFPFLDICFFLETSSKVWDMDPSYSRTFRYQRHLIYPLVQRPFEGMMLVAPQATQAVLEHNYDLAKCQSARYSHRDEQWRNGTESVPCKELYGRFPFVFRTNLTRNVVNETMRIGARMLDWKVV